MADPKNGWNEWSKHVLLELERLDESIKTMDDHVKRMHVDLATLKVKSGVWGALAGLIPAVAALLIIAIRG